MREHMLKILLQCLAHSKWQMFAFIFSFIIVFVVYIHVFCLLWRFYKAKQNFNLCPNFQESRIMKIWILVIYIYIVNVYSFYDKVNHYFISVMFVTWK